MFSLLATLNHWMMSKLLFIWSRQELNKLCVCVDHHHHLTCWFEWFNHGVCVCVIYMQNQDQYCFCIACKVLEQTKVNQNIYHVIIIIIIKSIESIEYWTNKHRKMEPTKPKIKKIQFRNITQKKKFICSGLVVIHPKKTRKISTNNLCVIQEPWSKNEKEKLTFFYNVNK